MVSLSPDEIVLFQGSARYNGTRGTFYLTTKKVTFDYSQRGVFFKGQYTALDLPLERISTLSVIGAGPFKKLAINTVRDNQSVGIPRHEFNVDNPEKWMTEIEVARRTQKESIFTVQKEIKETTIREIVKIKCAYCGMLVDQNLSRCPNCNSLVK
jgi:hypothetical protein